VLQGRVERVVIPVADQEVGLSFYRSMLSSEGLPASKGRTYFDLGDVLLCIYSPIDDGDLPVGPLSVPVYFTVDEPALWFERLSGLDYKAVTPIERKPWGETRLRTSVVAARDARGF
jgi:hypothetical protein